LIDPAFKHHIHEDAPPSLFLNDVTSSFLEGRCNAHVQLGYNWDCKRGKQQILVEMMNDREGLRSAYERRSNTCMRATRI